MALSATATSLAEVLDEMTAEGAAELTEHLPGNALRCFACGHRCLIKEGKRGICKVRFNEGGHLRVPVNYVAALACDPTLAGTAPFALRFHDGHLQAATKSQASVPQELVQAALQALKLLQLDATGDVELEISVSFKPGN